MVTKILHTPKGILEKELSQQEVEEYAKEGDWECRKELTKQKMKKAKTLEEVKELICQLLEVL